MKRIIKVGVLLTVLLILAACGADEPAATNGDEIAPPVETYEAAESEGSTEEESQPKSRDELRADFADNALQPASQLILGTLMLEETEYAVDADLAPYLTPYWKMYRSLLESDTTAPEELAALIDEIQEVMYADQVNYIASLELTQEDLMAYMNEAGIMENMRPEGAEEGDEARPGRPDGGDGMPGGGTGPGGGQGGQGGGMDGMDPEVMATMQAEREAGGGGGGGVAGNRMITPLIEALIELLEGKVD